VNTVLAEELLHTAIPVSPSSGPRLAPLPANPAVALTIDTLGFPPRSLTVRGVDLEVLRRSPSASGSTPYARSAGMTAPGIGITSVRTPSQLTHAAECGSYVDGAMLTRRADVALCRRSRGGHRSRRPRSGCAEQKSSPGVGEPVGELGGGPAALVYE
jgi:hypothetical protein